MSEKRFECVFKDHETKNSWSMIKDNQLDKPLYIKDVVDLLNEQQATIEQKDKQLQKAKEYFMDYLSREMSANNFSELWDLVIDDE